MRSAATTRITNRRLDVAPLSDLMAALADERRLTIVALLAHGELCVCHLQSVLAIPQPNVSRHLAVLRAAGVVDARRAGTWIHYRLRGQRDPRRRAWLAVLVREFGRSPALRREVERLRRARGPRSCR